MTQIICPLCGNVFDPPEEEKIHCPDCGELIPSHDPTSPGKQLPKNNEPAPPSLRLLLLLGAIFIFSCFCFLIICLGIIYLWMNPASLSNSPPFTQQITSTKHIEKSPTAEPLIVPPSSSLTSTFEINQITTATTIVTPTFFPLQTPTRTKTSTTTPTETPSAKPEIWHPCPGIYPSRLHVNDDARVTFYPPYANRLRVGPGIDYEIIGKVDPGGEIIIVDGPECANNWIWWKVESVENDLIGWTSEGDQENYWLEPLN